MKKLNFSERDNYYLDEDDRIQKGDRFKLAVFFSLTVLVSVSVLHYVQHVVGWDPLANPIVNGPYVSIDSWSIIHVLTFALLAFLYPGDVWLFMFFGILWEAIEFILAGGSDFWKERGVNSSWDIFFNLLGYRIGEFAFVFYLNFRDRKRVEVAKKDK